MSIEKFTIAIPDAELDDLRQRLERVRWADDYANDDWRDDASGPMQVVPGPSVVSVLGAA